MELEIKNDNELGIYIHIPFCKKKCYYCDFTSFELNKLVKNEEEQNENKQIENEIIFKYISNVIKEINEFDFSKFNVTTIYIGGGTPSYIDEKYIEDILMLLKQKIDACDKNKRTNQIAFNEIEITIEINPGTVNEMKFKKYKLIGINRLSIGLQSGNDKLLKTIGRIHTYQEFENVYNLARKIGFENMSFDLIIGLPNQTIVDIKNTLEIVKKLDPNHVSIYSLIVEEDTVLEEKIANNELELPEEEIERNMYWYVKNNLESMGYNHYEISNFSKKGKESKHNMNCWEQKQYIGFGLAAHSYINNIRFSNQQNKDGEIYDYESFQEEKQNLEEAMNEYMLLGLRKINGVDISKFKEKYINNPIYVYMDQLNELVEKDMLIVDGNYIKLTNKGIDFANQVWEMFV